MVKQLWTGGFDDISIIIDSKVDILEKQNLFNKLLYIEWECFTKTLRDVKPTYFIKHLIDLKPNTHPF